MICCLALKTVVTGNNAIALSTQVCSSTVLQQALHNRRLRGLEAAFSAAAPWTVTAPRITVKNAFVEVTAPASCPNLLKAP